MSRRYFLLNILGDDQDRELTFLDVEPSEILDVGFRLATGKPLALELQWPLDFVLQPESPGLRLPTLIGNIMGYLVVRNDLKELIEKEQEKVEFFPINIVNHKGKLHSKDYWIVNPLMFVDCLDKKESRITYSQGLAPATQKKVVSVKNTTLNQKNISPDANLFRIPELAREYVVSDKLAAMMKKQQFTNVYLEEIQIK